MIEDFEKPEYFPGKLRRMENARPHISLLTGMSDFSGWKTEWVWNLTDQAHALGIPVFMKEELLPIMGEMQMIQEWPTAFCRVLEEQTKWQKS